MNKKLYALIAVSIAILVIPMINALSVKRAHLDNINDGYYKTAAGILHDKCIDCHSSSGVIPFYAKIPFARKLIEKDIKEGKERFNLDDKFLGKGERFTELDLARLEGVLYSDSMSPMRYKILHWNSGLKPNEKNSIKEWIYLTREERRKKEGLEGKRLGEPIPPLKENTSLDSRKVSLGREMFHDTRLSGDGTISCASCHSLSKGGTDQAVSSTGIKGQIGPINAPTVYNAVYNHRQFWDGRAQDLEAQAAGPVTNPLEMGADWQKVLAKLSQDESLVNAFKENYTDGLTQKNILNSIAIFEQSLVTPNSRFDKYLKGDDKALSLKEHEGYRLFKNNCISCHAGPNLGGLSFEKLGVKKDYFVSRGSALTTADLGLANYTKNNTDAHKFKVPTLRNIELTSPYFHDGSAKNLEEAVKIMATHQSGKNLKEKEIAAIAQFLRSLNGEYQGKPLDQF